MVKLNEDYPTSVGGLVKFVRIRMFPKTTRILVKVREETERVRYIIFKIKDQDDVSFVVRERKVLKDNLKPLTKSEKETE